MKCLMVKLSSLLFAILISTTAILCHGQEELVPHYDDNDEDTFAVEAYEEFPDLALPTPGSNEKPYIGSLRTSTARAFIVDHVNDHRPPPATIRVPDLQKTPEGNAIAFVNAPSLEHPLVRGDAKVIEKFFELTRRHKSGYKMFEKDEKPVSGEVATPDMITASTLPTVVRLALGIDENTETATTEEFEPPATKDMFILGNKYLKTVTATAPTTPFSSRETPETANNNEVETSEEPGMTTTSATTSVSKMPFTVTTAYNIHSSQLSVVRNETAAFISNARRAEYYRMSMIAMKAQLKAMTLKIDNLKKIIVEMKNNSNTCQPWDAQSIDSDFDDANEYDEQHRFGAKSSSKTKTSNSARTSSSLDLGAIDITNPAAIARTRELKPSMRVVGKEFPIMTHDGKASNQPHRSTFLIGGQLPATDLKLETQLQIEPDRRPGVDINGSHKNGVVVHPLDGGAIGLITKKHEEKNDDADENDPALIQDSPDLWHSSAFDNQHLWPDILFRDQLRRIRA